MEVTLVNEVKDTLEHLNNKFKDDPMIHAFEKASQEFKLLVEKGIVKERGYNLMTIEEAHLRKVSFNSVK